MQLSGSDAFEIESSTADGASVVAVRGEVDVHTAPALDAALETADGMVVVDLCSCSFIDSSGLGVLIRHAQRLPALAVAVAPGGEAHDLMSVAGVTGGGVAGLSVYDSRDAALSALRDAAA